MKLGQSVPIDPAPNLPYCGHLINTLTTMKEPILMPCCNQSQSFIPISLVFTEHHSSPIQDTTLHVTGTSPSAPCGYASFSGFPCFWWPWQFWRIPVRYLAECSPPGICLIFSHHETGVMCLERKRPPRSSAFFGTSHLECLLSSWPATVDTRLGPLAEVVSARFLSRDCSLFPLSVLYSLERCPSVEPVLTDWVSFLLLEGGGFCKLFVVLLCERLANNLPHFCAYMCIYVVVV